MEISACPLFRGIPEKDLPALLEGTAARRVSFQKGELLLRRGEVTRRLGLVLTGTVRNALFYPFNSVNTGVFPSAFCKNCKPPANTLCVNRQNHALAAVLCGGIFYERRIFKGSRINADLIRTAL